MQPLGITQFVGRNEELAQLRAMLQTTLAGVGTKALIEGEAGIGKTRLVDEALSEVSEAGLHVWRGAAEELERGRPFGVIADALQLTARSEDPDRSDATRLLHGHLDATSSTTEQQPLDLGFAIIDAITSLVEGEAVKSPVVLVLEDLHWADSGSVRSVHTLGASLSTLPIALVLTRRPYPRSAELDRLVDPMMAQGGLHLRLDPLDRSDVAQLAAHVLGAQPEQRILDQLERTAGNPLFTIELLRVFREAGLDEPDGADARPGEIPAPSLNSTVLRRLSLLSDETLEVLRIASVLGSSFSPRDLSAVMERPPLDLLRILTDAVDGGFLKEDGDALSFRHDVIREAIYNEVPAGVRKELHRHVGMTLANAGASAASVAGHLSIGASPGDAAATSLLHEAARDIAPRSAAAAVELLTTARSLTPTSSALHGLLAADLARSLFVLGRLSEAEEIVREVLPSEHDPQLGRVLAVIRFFRGDRQDARDVFDERGRSNDAPAVERATDLALAALASPFLGDLEGAITRAEQAQTLGDEAGSELALALSYCALAFTARYQGRIKDALEFARRGVEIGARTRWTSWEVLFLDPGYLLAAASLEAGQLGDARDGFSAGRQSREDLGYLWLAALHLMGLAVTQFMAGDWDDAATTASDCLSLAVQAESDWSVGMLPRVLIALVAIHRGDLVAAETSLAEAQEAFNREGPQVGIGVTMWARGLLAEARGEQDVAFDALRDGWNFYRTFGFFQDFYMHRSVGTDVVRVALAAGDRPFAESVAADLDSLAARESIPVAVASSHRAYGLINSDPAALDKAARAFGASGLKAEAAFAMEDLGLVWRQRGDLLNAVPPLEDALHVYERLDARRDIARVDAALRECGVRRRRRKAGGRPKTGWESLTETELRVVNLVAAGLTNRQIGQRLFISRRTAETHVGHALQKLGFSTRVELAAEAARRGQ